jgi:hypothetical protein
MLTLRFHVHREPGDNGIYANVGGRCVRVAVADSSALALLISKDRAAMADFEDYQLRVSARQQAGAFVCSCGHQHADDVCGVCECVTFNPIAYTTVTGDTIVFGSEVEKEKVR